ncbi:MAG: 2,3-bisphosphoglycerate-independent phosphoglycerate mutase [Synechococcus sp. SB0678_bin_12]|nr:2,3-bisphosphoglycerate-independent phosphoglycerate mutase [Synechococcus sp. SB0678_bin_12]
MDRQPQEAPVVLVILDGWGHRESAADNAIRVARTPNMDALWQTHPHTLIQASGSAVGLPDGQMRNSEVGHLTIGSGRIVRQELVRIGHGIRDGSFRRNPQFNALAQRLKDRGATLHLVGLLSDGGVHSHVDHLAELLRWAASRRFSRVCVHGITDGRDTADHGGLGHVKNLQQLMTSLNCGQLTTLCGRYWAMDRDHRWERTAKAYRLLTEDDGNHHPNPGAAVAASYAEGIGDEFLEPHRFAKGALQPGDGLICFNFRPDRVRQIIRALVLEDFNGFSRPIWPSPLDVVTFTQYERGLPVEVAFPPQPLDHLLGDVMADHGLRQFRIAETEKYPHVTYFFNGGKERPLPGEDRHLVPSPQVATYDQAPAMSAWDVTDGVISAIAKGVYSLIVVNYANPDMVGHTGIMDAAVQAIETVDACVGRIAEATHWAGGTMLITADHGNAETMRSPAGKPWTAHTTNPVPLLLLEGGKRKISSADNLVELRDNGTLADLAPTILDILRIPVPPAMGGRSLIASSSRMRSVAAGRTAQVLGV